MNKKVRTDDKRPKWEDKFYVRAYRLARDGHSDASIHGALGVKKDTWYHWLKVRPALQEAVDEGREAKSGGVGKFVEFVKGKMPAELVPMWEALTGDKEELRAEAIGHMATMKKSHRQHLFVRAYISCRFNVSMACRLVGINPLIPAAWRRADPKFKKMMETIHEAKKDFFEDALMDLVAARDTSATIFANRTVNRDRGYDQRVTVKIEGEVKQDHVIRVADLSQETLAKLLEETRAKKQRMLLGHKEEDVQDAEFDVVEPEEDE